MSTPTTVAEPGVRKGFDLAGWALAAYAFALPVVLTTSGISYLLIPKVALSLLVLGPGLIVLGLLAWRRDVPACWAVGFLVVAAVAAAISDVPALAMVGGYAMLNGWLLYAACLAVWALGRCVPHRTRLLSVALIAGTLVNAALAWAESAVNLRKVWAGFGLTDGRPFAFMANPVHLAALCAAALWLVLSREADRREPTPWLLAVALLVGATNLAGSRIALVLAALMVIGFAILLTRRRWWIHAAVLVVAATVGFGLSLLPGESGQAGNSRVVSTPTSGISSRIEVWEHAVQATFDRPFLGWGPGRSYQATSPRRSVQAARSEGPEIIYRDMHNFLVEVLVGTGVLGFLAFGGWLVTAGRRARGPLAGFAAVGAVVLMVQPALFMFAPLLTLALGAASADGDDAVRLSRGLWSSRSLQIASTVTVVIGLGAGVWLLAADSDYYRATSDRQLAPLDSWASSLTPWPEQQSLTAKLWDAQAAVQPTSDAGRRAIRAELVARDRDPYDPRAWVAYGVLQQKWGSRREARRAYIRALTLNPWGVQALRNLLSMAAEDGDAAGVKRYRATLCEIGPDWCPSQAQIDAAAQAGTATGG